MDRWPSRFESLGDNCEWGFVQRHYGVDEGSLLKWCRIKRIDDIINFLESDFSSFYKFENLTPVSEDMVVDSDSQIEYHTELYSERNGEGWVYKGAPAELIPRYDLEYTKRRYLLDKFVDDLRSGQKIWIYKENKSVAVRDVNRLASALQRHNPQNILLYIDLESGRDPPPAASVVEGDGDDALDVIDGVFVRSIKSLAPYWAVTEAVPQHWYEVCVKLLLDLERLGAGKARLGEFHWLPGRTGRHLRPTSLTTRSSDEVDERVRQNIRARAERFKEAWSGPNSWVSRFEIGAYYVAPLIAQMSPKSDARVLEIGCGQGQKALSYLPFVGSVLGIDIDADHVDYATRAARAMGVENAEFRCVEAEDIKTLLQSEQFDIVVLYAVLEHLTPNERQNLLRTLWAHVRDDGVVLVGETPNRVASFDSHTTNLQFVDILTNELYLDYTSHFSPRTDYRDFMSRFDDKLMGSYRAGRGVSFHEFDLMFGTQGAITPHIFSDSFNALLRNAYPISKAELSFLDMFRWHQFPVDQVFSRYWIEMFLKKSANGASANARSFAIQNPTHGENQVIGCDIYGLPAFGLPGPSSFLTFDVPNSTTGIQFMFDVGESTGAVEVFDQSARVFEIFEIEDLRSRVPEFQRYVAVDRPLSPGCEQLTIRPLGAASRVISGGLGLFGAPPLGPLDPRNPRILSAATF